jgi:ribosomal protein S8
MKTLLINYSIIKNGLAKKFSSVFIHKSKLTLSFLDLLLREGVISGYYIISVYKIEVFFKYYKGRPVLTDIVPVSTSGKLIYYNLDDICLWKKYHSSVHSFLVLNSSKSIFSSNELKNYKIGGQVLCLIK